MKKEEKLIEYIIPENCGDTGRCLNGLVRTRNVIEGAIFAVPLAMYILESGLDMNNTILAVLLGPGCIMALFIAGINGDSVFEFLQHYHNFRNRKRIAKFNPRIKKEVIPGYLTSSGTELPRDKLVKFLDAVNLSGEPDEPVSPDIYSPIYQEFFEDDLGVLTTPDDLKSKKELKQEAKKRKTAAKLAQKQEKKEEKARRKAEKAAMKARKKGV